MHDKPDNFFWGIPGTEALLTHKYPRTDQAVVTENPPTPYRSGGLPPRATHPETAPGRIVSKQHKQITSAVSSSLIQRIKPALAIHLPLSQLGDEVCPAGG